MKQSERVLTTDEQVALYNAVSIADRYTAQLPEDSGFRQQVRRALEICTRRGFPYVTSKPLQVRR